MSTRPAAEQIELSSIVAMPNVTNIQQAIEQLSSRSTLTYSTQLRNARMQAIVSTVGSGGKLEIGTIGMGTVLVIMNLNSPIGTVANGILTFSGMPKTSYATASGFAVEARILDASNQTVISGITVGRGVGYHIQLDSIQINVGQPVTVSNATMVHF